MGDDLGERWIPHFKGVPLKEAKGLGYLRQCCCAGFAGVLQKAGVAL
jgi:hypothetical protein